MPRAIQVPDRRDDTSTEAGVGETPAGLGTGLAAGAPPEAAGAGDSDRPEGATGVATGGSVPGSVGTAVRPGRVAEGPTGSRIGGGPGSGGPGGGVGPRAAPPMSIAATSDFTPVPTASAGRG